MPPNLSRCAKLVPNANVLFINDILLWRGKNDVTNAELTAALKLSLWKLFSACSSVVAVDSTHHDV